MEEKEQPVEQQPAQQLSQVAVLYSLKEAYRTDDSGMKFWEVARSHRYGQSVLCHGLDRHAWDVLCFADPQMRIFFRGMMGILGVCWHAQG